MSILLTAIGATVAALLEFSLFPYLQLGGAVPHLVAALAVIVTIAGGFEIGMTWAVAGGVALDVLAGRPLGMSVFVLLLVAGGALAFARGLMRLRAVAPIVAVPGLTFVYSILLLFLMSTLRSPIPVPDPVTAVAPGIAYDFLVGLVLGPLVVAVHDRRIAEERVDW
jgi:rod shape-determining protein MreD